MKMNRWALVMVLLAAVGAAGAQKRPVVRDERWTFKAAKPTKKDKKPPADAKKTYLSPTTMKVGQVGWFGETKDPDGGVVVSVNKRSAVIRSSERQFIVARVDTTGLTDDTVVRLAGLWWVSGTRKVGSATLFVVELIEEEKKAKK